MRCYVLDALVGIVITQYLNELLLLPWNMQFTNYNQTKRRSGSSESLVKDPHARTYRI